MNSPLQTVPRPVAALSQQQKVDRFGELDRQIQLLAPLTAAHRALKEEIESWHRGDAGDTPVVEKGVLYEVQMSPRRNERTVVNKKKVFALLKAALGIDGIVALVNLPFEAAIDKYIPKSSQKGLINEERSGYRTFTVVALQPAAPALELPAA
jgi:hypothetical protein